MSKRTRPTRPAEATVARSIQVLAECPEGVRVLAYRVVSAMQVLLDGFSIALSAKKA